MAAVGGPERSLVHLVKRTKLGKIKVACVNSPESVTVSGDDAAIDEFQDMLKELDIFNRK
jgi:acyl transferase domain-containing protein